MFKVEILLIFILLPWNFKQLEHEFWCSKFGPFDAMVFQGIARNLKVKIWYFKVKITWKNLKLRDFSRSFKSQIIRKAHRHSDICHSKVHTWKKKLSWNLKSFYMSFSCIGCFDIIILELDYENISPMHRFPVHYFFQSFCLIKLNLECETNFGCLFSILWSL